MLNWKEVKHAYVEAKDPCSLIIKIFLLKVNIL